MPSMYINLHRLLATSEKTKKEDGIQSRGNFPNIYCESEERGSVLHQRIERYQYIHEK
jgi:hypothetical protein